MAFEIITPITITDAILTGSNVPENDDQEYDTGTSYVVGDTVMVATSTANIHKTYESLVSQNSGLTADLLDENFSDISDWTESNSGDADTQIYPTGQLNLVSNASVSYASIYRTLVSPPDTHSIEIKTYFDALGSFNVDCLWLNYYDTNWQLSVLFASNGLFVQKTGISQFTEVGTNIIKANATAAWQTWRFEVTKTTPSTATCEVFLKEEGGEWVSQGTVDCDLETGGTDGKLLLKLWATYNGNIECHIDYVRMASGLGALEDLTATPVGSTNWLEVDSTNRWKAFNGVLGSQTEQATKIEYVLTPGEAIDSVALLNLESDTVDIVEIDSADDIVTNGQSFTGATGTTQPTSWDKVKTPAAYLIDSGAIKITTNDTEEGMSQTIAVTAGVEYQLLFFYKNTSGDTAQYAVYDMTHSADILATTDLTSDTAYASCGYVFTTPAGCMSIKISFLGKANGDIVWFDNIRLCPTEYSETVTTGTAKTDVVKTDIPQIATGILTVTINKSGTVAIGELIIGTKTSLGTMKYSPQIGITDYSTKTQDTFGNWDITPRGYSKNMSCNMRISNTNLDSVFYALTNIIRESVIANDGKKRMRVWIGDPNYTCLIVYGFYKDFQIVIPYKNWSDCSLEIEGII